MVNAIEGHAATSARDFAPRLRSYVVVSHVVHLDLLRAHSRVVLGERRIIDPPALRALLAAAPPLPDR